ncbi:hypothetical protein [Marinobacter sp. CHS3-4]|uniref:hypothetical protein n=1 Tax=Marinobacter sp. CHS3-4 TaxID=3045174 RepID=UPI0024B56CDA|nr:hypothetical protein [Marinobacter sp. CHS3-4]MDI9245658.1 hypothetical protein [Marinobacter sp. CHS3-4]
MQLLKIVPFFKVFLLSLTLTLVGCGGGSSGGGGGGSGSEGATFSGNTSPAEIDQDNAEDIGLAAGESVDKASASGGLPSSPLGVRVSGPIDMDELNDIVLQTGQQLSMPSGVLVEDVCSSGTADVSGLSNASRTTITYNNCVLDGTAVTVDGSAVIEYENVNDPTAGFSITYNNFTVTDPNSGTQTINAVLVCSDTGCTYNSDFVGQDGVTHRVTDFSVTGDRDNGFNGSATFFHGTHGSVTITISNLTYGSCGTVPDSGSISFSGTNGTSGTINFNGDCTVTGTWNNGTTSGSF